jgi:membrane AbrB-like protein
MEANAHRARSAGATVLLLAVVMAGAQGLHVLGVPAAALFAGLLVGLLAAMARHVAVAVPWRLYALGQGVLGVVIGMVGTTAMSAPGSAVVAVPLVVLATMVLSLLAGRLLARHRLVGVSTGLLGMVAGGSAAVISAADETGADARIVAVSQYLRVAAVALTAPVVAHLLAGSAYTPAAVPSGEELSEQVFSGVTVLAVAVAGITAGRRLRLPAAPLAGPLLLALGLAFAGLVPEAPPPPVMPQLAFGLVGAEIGLRFEPTALRALRSVLPLIVLLTIALSVGCAAIAISMSVLAGVPVVDAYLMTTPGGINAIVATAVSLHGVDVGLVTLAQIVRMLAMVCLMPAVVRFLRRPR